MGGTGVGLRPYPLFENERRERPANEVRVESSPAGGARFVLTLPVLPDDDGDDGDDGVHGDGPGGDA